MKTTVSRITGLLLLLVLLWPAAGALATDTAKTWYLRNSGPSAFNLTLSETQGSLTSEVNTTSNKSWVDTTFTVAGGTTAFFSVGTFSLPAPLSNQAISDLGSASLWVGLANVDDAGLDAVVRVEVLKNTTTVISTTDSACLDLARVPASAASIDLPAPVSPVAFGAGDTLSMRLSARRCNTGSPASGRMRFHYNRSDRDSKFTATVTDTVDLSITKTDSPDPVTAGNNLTYTATVTNNGPNTATGVSFSDPLPAGVTLVSATPSQGAACTGPTTVSCNLGTITAGNSATVTIVVKVGADTRGSLSNSASVTATQPDPTTPNIATASTTVQASADLSISKTDSPDPVTAGESLTYTITVTNAGPSTATAATVTDPLPAGLTLVSATPSQGGPCTGTTTVSCNLGTLNVGSNATVTIVATVSPSATGPISNTASVAATENDPTPSNQATASTAVQKRADLSITKTDSPDPVTAGESLTYTITVTNAGPSTATAVTVTDPLPASLTLVSATPSQGAACTGSTTVSCNLGTIANGGSATVTIVGTVSASATGPISNTASVAGAEPDPTTPNEATSSTTVEKRADLSITKTDSPDPVTAGESLTYTITVTNNGPSTATAVTVTDPLPASLALVSATPSQGAACTGTTTVSCNLGTLNVGSSATVTIVATVSPSATGTISNTASVAGAEPDPTTPNEATASTTVQRKADLSITKTDSPDPVLPGGALTYTITVTNNGPSTATAVTVTDPLPASLTLVTATSSQGAACTGTTTVSCNLGTIANGSSATVTIVGTVSASATGTISNTASVAGAEPDPTTPNEATAITAVSVPQGADLSVSKTDSPDPVLQGKELTYTITVHNGGPAQATGVQLTDTLPAGVTFVSVVPGAPTCALASGTVTCNLGSIDNGSDSIVTIKVKPGAAAAQAGTITNTASVTSTSTDTNSDNNSASATTAVTKDTDEDGLPDSIDCNKTIADDRVVGPASLVPPTFNGTRHDTLQAAVIAASDNDVISMLADTIENVVIGDSTGSGGKDMIIYGCSSRVFAASSSLPVIRVENSAGANDGDTGAGERDIELVGLDVRNGSGGFLIETSKVGGAGTDTFLKAVRAESSSGVGVKIVGSGNEMDGANGVKFHAGIAIQVIGNSNLITGNRAQDNNGAALVVTGGSNLIEKNKIGDGDHGNGSGIAVSGNSNQLKENDVFENSGPGITVTGNSNLLFKNDVGDGDKGNLGDGIHVSGLGNTIDQNNVFSNTGDGIDVSGGTAASPNIVKNNDIGSRGEGNQGNGILYAGAGNAASPVEIENNTVKANLLAGIKVTGTACQIKNNVSGGSGDETNGGCEYDLATGNFDGGGNTANGAGVALIIPGCTGS